MRLDELGTPLEIPAVLVLGSGSLAVWPSGPCIVHECFTSISYLPYTTTIPLDGLSCLPHVAIAILQQHV